MKQWRWVIDRRGGDTRVAVVPLFVSVAVGLAAAAVFRVVLRGNWFYAIVIPLGLAAVLFDIWTRARGPQDPNEP